MEVPVSWYLNGETETPMKHLFLNDINGDGRTDLGCLTAANTVAFWLARKEGIDGDPDFEHSFDQPIQGVALESDLEGAGYTTVALRTSGALYVLRPTSWTMPR